MEVRICIGECGQEKPLTEEFFYRHSVNNKFRNICKDCCNKEKKERYLNNKQNEDQRVKDYYNNHKQERKEYRIGLGIITGKGQTIPENNISKYLIKKKIYFESEKTFTDCRNLNNELLYFDFFIPNFNIIIEFDGPFHFKPIFGEEKLKRVKEYDQLKNTYCLIKGIQLIRISDINKIEEILEEIFIEITN